MRRKIPVFLAAALLLGLLACCGSQEAKPAEMDLAAVAAALEAGEVYSDILNPPFEDIETVTMLYGLEAADIANCIVRCSTGATAEEMALFQSIDEAAAQRIETAMKARIDTQKSAFENYVPEEIPKLEQAQVLRSGVYVAYVTAADAGAVASILDQYFV